MQSPGSLNGTAASPTKRFPSKTSNPFKSLPDASTSITVTVTESGQWGSVVCLPLKPIPGFLFGINASRVKPELKEKIIRYRRECFDVLAEAFEEGRLTATDGFEDLLATDTAAVQAYKIATAIMQIARQQILLEAQIGKHATRLDEYGQRLEVVETVLGDPGRHVTPEQASQLSQAVKAVAMELSKQSGRNEYGGVYGELYRKFSITSYKLLPASKFDDVMNWLTEWHQTLVGEEPF